MNKYSNQSKELRSLNLFLLNYSNVENRREALKYLRDIGVNSISIHSNCALYGLATDDQTKSARVCGLFKAIFRKSIKKETYEKLTPEEQDKFISTLNKWLEMDIKISDL